MARKSTCDKNFYISDACFIPRNEGRKSLAGEKATIGQGQRKNSTSSLQHNLSPLGWMPPV